MRISHKITAIVAVILLLVIGGCSAWLYYNYSGLNLPQTDNEIVKFELQTHEYFENAPTDAKYRIRSTDDLDAFYSIYSNALSLDVSYLSANDIFIMVQPASSGGIQHQLTAVNLTQDTVNFEIKTTSPEISTDDMAFWYFVAVIPRDKLKNIDASDWIKPINNN